MLTLTKGGNEFTLESKNEPQKILYSVQLRGMHTRTHTCIHNLIVLIKHIKGKSVLGAQILNTESANYRCNKLYNLVSFVQKNIFKAGWKRTK